MRASQLPSPDDFESAKAVASFAHKFRSGSESAALAGDLLRAIDAIAAYWAYVSTGPQHPSGVVAYMCAASKVFAGHVVEMVYEKSWCPEGGPPTDVLTVRLDEPGIQAFTGEHYVDTVHRVHDIVEKQSPECVGSIAMNITGAVVALPSTSP